MTSKELPAPFSDAIHAVKDLDLPLRERLAVLAERTRRERPEFAAAIDRLVARLRQSGAASTTPGPGDLMPAFVLPDENGRLMRLQDFLSEGPTVVSFHRGHWCPFCRTNITALAKAQGDIAALKAQIVAVTPDRAKYTTTLRELSGATFPILTDVDNGYALLLDLVIWLDWDMQTFIRARGHNVAKSQGNATWMVPIPATFVVRPDGVIQERYLDPDYRTRVSIEDLLTALRQAL